MFNNSINTPGSPTVNQGISEAGQSLPPMMQGAGAASPIQQQQAIQAALLPAKGFPPTQFRLAGGGLMQRPRFGTGQPMPRQVLPGGVGAGVMQGIASPATQSGLPGDTPNRLGQPTQAGLGAAGIAAPASPTTITGMMAQQKPQPPQVPPLQPTDTNA